MAVDLLVNVGVVGIMVVSAGLFGLLCERNHVLMVLLMLEVIMLGLYFLLEMVVGSLLVDGYLCLLLISFAACEASVGLGLLVSLVRSHGSDFVSVLGLYEC